MILFSIISVIIIMIIVIVSIIIIITIVLYRSSDFASFFETHAVVKARNKKLRIDSKVIIDIICIFDLSSRDRWLLNWYNYYFYLHLIIYWLINCSMHRWVHERMNQLYININTCTQHYHYHRYHAQCIIIACITSMVTIFHSSTVNSANIIPIASSLFLAFSINIIIVINIFITIMIIIIIAIFIIPTIIIIIIFISLICYIYIYMYTYIYSHGLVNSRKQ